MSDFSLSQSMARVDIWIDRLLNDYAPRLEKTLQRHSPGGGQAPPETEESLLNGLDSLLDDGVRLFNKGVVSRPYSRSGGLVLEAFIFDPADASADLQARRRALLRGLMAAEIESQGEYRLHRAQNTVLATCYEMLGEQFGRARCFAHAAFAYERAADVYLLLQDESARDRCKLAQRRMKSRQRPPGVIRFGMALADLLCGYGYKPGRMLVAMLLQLVVFSVLLALFSSDDLALALHTCLINYLNPLGLGDVSSLQQPGTEILVVESYAGSFSMTIFGVVLVRKWFRM